ncbi:SPOR domain-containing protein [Pseudophaeobacter sp.]|uniref:SPOR domain-containing protein n=1 Tax=Pseudophaeobacter sp. TaxID=1971739 RepID=UPI0040582105
MAYFAQAGSGRADSHDSTRNEGAVDPSAQAQTGPRLTVQPQVTARSRPIQASEPPHSPLGAQPALRAEPRISTSSAFPAEGPDLYTNYQPRSDDESSGAAAASFGYAAAPSSAIPLPEAQQPALQDYVSQDYAVPGIGTHSYAAQMDHGQDYASQSFAAHSAPEQDSESLAYGGAAPQSYGYAADESEDYGYDDHSYATAAAPRGGVARVASLLGAAASLALVIGIGTWGYQLVMRDVSGVPVVRAVEGPMRSQPETPGGSQADHQGLAVNSVAANGTAAAPAERLTLAPQPIELSEDDQPMSRLTAPEADLPPQPVNQPSVQADAQISEASVDAYRAGDINSLVAELTDGVVPIARDPAAARPSPVIVQPEPLQPVEIAAIGAAVAPSSALLNAPGVKVSLRPNLRPARFSPATSQPSANAGLTTREIDPGSLPAGTRLAQLGAYESAAVARAEWDRIYSRFEDYLEGKNRVIQRAESGGRTFYRLRAMGFDGLSDARRFCSALVASNADCIPVTTR